MPKRYFNWKLAIVLVLGLAVLGTAAFGLRRWQRNNRAELGLELGIKAYNQQSWEEAAKYLGRYVAVKPDHVPSLLKYAEAQLNIRPLKLSNIKHAEVAWRRVLRVDKSNLQAALNLTEMYVQIGTPGEAELIAARQLQINQDPKLRRILAVALAHQRKFNEAAAELKAIIAEHPDQILVYETLGQLAEQNPERFPEPPEHWFNEAVKNNPSSALAYIIRAGFYLRKNNIPKALSDLEQAEKQDLSDPDVRLQLAREFINANILDKAEQHFAAVQIAKPANQKLWQTWAQLALKSKSPEKMIEIAETGLKELSSQPWDFMPTAAELFIRAGQLDRATECISQLRQKDIAPATVASLEGLLAHRQGRLFEAVKRWQQSIESGNKSPQTRLILASTLSRLGDTQTATRQLRTLVSESPNFFDGRLALARMLAQTQNWAETAEQARIARQLAPDNLDAALLHLQAQIQLLTAQSTNLTPENAQIWKDIEQQLTKLENTAKDSLEVKLLRFYLELQQSKFADADALITQLTKIHPTEIRVAMAEVDLLATQDKTEQVILKLTEIIKKFPEAVEPAKYLSLLLERQNEQQKCEEILKDTLTSINEPIAQRQLGILLADLYSRCDQQEKAYALLTSLAAKLPNDVPIKRWLLRCPQVVNNTEQAQQLVDDIKSLEGNTGWQWRYEQARLWFNSSPPQAGKERYPQIISLLQENLLTNPGDQTSLILLAATYERSGELQLAISSYRNALNHSPDDIHIIIPAVAALYKAKEYDQADEILKRTSETKLHHPELQKLQLQSYLRRGQLSSASDILQDIISNDPNNKAAYLSLAILKIQQNNFAEADQLLAKLKSQEPNSLPVAYAQIQLNIRQNKTQDALKYCNELINNLNNASAYILRSRTYLALNQVNKAIEDLEHATAIEPNRKSVV